MVFFRKEMRKIEWINKRQQFGKASAENTLADGQNVRHVKIADDRVETMTKLTTWVPSP